MTQDTFISKILHEMIESNIITVDKSISARMYLEMTYSAGFNNAFTYKNNKKPVIRLNSIGTITGTYESIADAGRKNGINYKLICGALSTRAKTAKTAGGYFWKFKE